MRIEHEILELRTTHAFNISRAAGPEVRRTVMVRLIDGDGIEGWGEAPVSTPYYGETAETVVGVLPRLEAALRSALEAAEPAQGDVGRDGDSAGPLAGALGIEAIGVGHIERLEQAMANAVDCDAGARVALSAALHDLAGKRWGLPVWRMLGLSPDDAPVSSFTIGLDEPDVVREKLREARGYGTLKIKVGTPRDAEMLALVREEAPDTRLRVDANTGWDAATALARLPLLAEYGVELLEQPLPPDDLDGLRLVRAHSTIPIVADESCRTSADIPRLAGAVDAINIKLAKCGSLGEAVRMAAAARAHGMGVMLGCMVESSLGIAAGVQLAPLMDWVDLDGAALLANDPFAGPGIGDDGRIRFNGEAGLGVTRGLRGSRRERR